MEIVNIIQRSKCKSMKEKMKKNERWMEARSEKKWKKRRSKI